MTSFKANDVRNGIIIYRHTSGEIGIEPKKDTIHLALSDTSDELIEGGNIYNGIVIELVTVPVDSEPPRISGFLNLEVPEGGSKKLTKDVLLVTDTDTRLKEVSCKITKPPLFGYIQTSSPLEGSEISGIGKSISVISAYDLYHGYVSYVQSRHKKIEPTSDSFRVICTDGSNPAPEITIHVSITPTNDEAPIIFAQSNIVCVEDDLIMLNLAKINPYDQDQPGDEMIITVVTPPVNGELLLQKISELTPATRFTKSALTADLDSSLLYQHKGSETTSDSFELQVSDGIHNTTKVIHIIIISMDDETPRMQINTRLQMDRLETKVITYLNLKAVDLDSDDSNLMYIVMMEPVLGKLQKTISSTVTVDIRKGGNFTQSDIDARRIRYTHLNKKPGNRDIIRLDVTDGFNRLINQIFNVMITPEDNIPPNIVNQGITMRENNRVTLTTDMLSAADLNSPDEKLQFIITKTPLNGHLEHKDTHGVPITKFSQLDLAARNILYTHTSQNEVKTDNFEFEVTDGRNRVFRTFRVKIIEVNNKKPVLYRNIISGTQYQKTVITPFELNAIDNDTVAKNIKFKIYHLPKYGQILMDGKNPVVLFSQEDLENNRIIYQHDGSQTRSDKFYVTVTDGKHKDFIVYPELSKSTSIPVKVDIEIELVDSRAPVLETNTGSSSLRMHNGVVMCRISDTKLKAADRESPKRLIRFSIRKQPRNGKVVRLDKKTKRLSKFTQEDISNRLIAYVLNNGSKATHDMFIFDVYDNSKNMLRGQSFYLNWPWIEIVGRNYQIKETDSSVTLNFIRTGYIGKTSFASIDIVNNSAKEFVHFIKDGVQVQFSPGQESATLKISILDNLKYEKLKFFSVFLRNGIKTLIGERNNATVEIFDPEDGKYLQCLFCQWKDFYPLGKVKICIYSNKSKINGNFQDVFKRKLN